jgi:hypothetical protein
MKTRVKLFSLHDRRDNIYLLVTANRSGRRLVSGFTPLPPFPLLQALSRRAALHESNLRTVGSSLNITNALIDQFNTEYHVFKRQRTHWADIINYQAQTVPPALPPVRRASRPATCQHSRSSDARHPLLHTVNSAREALHQ